MGGNISMYSPGYKLIRVGWFMQVWLFNYTLFVWLETLTMLTIGLLKLNNAKNVFLINSNIILYRVFSLNLKEY